MDGGQLSPPDRRCVKLGSLMENALGRAGGGGGGFGLGWVVGCGVYLVVRCCGANQSERFSGLPLCHSPL